MAYDNREIYNKNRGIYRTMKDSHANGNNINVKVNYDTINKKETVTKGYPKRSGNQIGLPLSLWVQDQDRAFRIEGRYLKGKSGMLSRTTGSDERTTEQGPKANDIPIIDKNWIMSKFMTPSKDLVNIDRTNRFFSTTGWKFSSTRLGYSLAINARPQFTRYADIKGNTRAVATGTRSFFQEVSKQPPPPGKNFFGLGMGRYYSESIDDNATTIFLEFGVPKFNSLINFFTRAVNPADSYIANKGRVPLGYYVGNIGGAYVMWCAFPLVSILVYSVKFVSNMFFAGPFNYYYMTPTMHTYWASVNIMVSQLATELGILSPVFLPDSKTGNKIGTPIGIDKEDMNYLYQYFPDIISPNTGYIDIFGVANRMQRIANEQSKREFEQYKKTGKLNVTELMGYVYGSKDNVSPIRQPQSDWIASINSKLSISNYFKRMGNDKAKTPVMHGGQAKFANAKADLPDSRPSKPLYKTDAEGKNPDIPEDYSGPILGSNGQDKKSEVHFNTHDGTFKSSEPEAGWFEKFAHGFDSVVRDGGSFAIFNVDYQGAVSESMSNSVSDINAGGLIKSVSQGARSVKFDVAGGNVLGEAQAAVTEQVGAFLKGVTESVTFGLSNVIDTLLGGAYVDIPKKWDDSSISFPTITYTMSLMSPYGNPISQLQNIFIPLCMILAGSLPLKAGQSAYTSPFLCSVFNKGVQSIKLGMITSVSINRGVNNLGFSRTKRALGYEVSFTVTDFSNIMTAPVNSSIFDEFFNFNVDDQSKFGQYMATLASRDIYSDKYLKPKLKMKASRMLMSFSQMTSPHSWSMMVGDVFKPMLGLFVEERKLGSYTQNNNNNYF